MRCLNRIFKVDASRIFQKNSSKELKELVSKGSNSPKDFFSNTCEIITYATHNYRGDVNLTVSSFLQVKQLALVLNPASPYETFFDLLKLLYKCNDIHFMGSTETKEIT